MAKLSKTKSFSVSQETLEVNFKGKICECANLLKSGIVNQTIVLVAYENVWHEINVLDLGGDDSSLEAFKNYIESMGLSLSDIGITTESRNKESIGITHDDFMSLEAKFPPHNYIQISLLNDYNVKEGGKASVDELTDWLKVCQRDKISINELIQSRIIEKQKFMKTETTIEVISEKPQTAKKPISLQVFETLTPERISELEGLNERQLEIVKENPVITITDKETYEQAKKTAAVLLKASTAIDGTSGIEATATKYLNTFKSMLKNALQPIALITRKPYDEQKAIISTWENAEEIKKQAEQREKLLKIKSRTDELFAVPFTFNGTVYSIGPVYIVGSQIENLPDNEFAEIVSKGKLVKQQLDAEAEVQKSKDAEIEALKAKLAMLENISNTEPATPTVTTPTVVESTNTTTVTQNVTYTIPPQENVLLNRLDLENVEHLEKPAYQKCRSYYVRGLKEVAGLIEDILNNPDVTIKKSVKINELITILKKSE